MQAWYIVRLQLGSWHHRLHKSYIKLPVPKGGHCAELTGQEDLSTPLCTHILEERIKFVTHEGGGRTVYRDALESSKASRAKNITVQFGDWPPKELSRPYGEVVQAWQCAGDGRHCYSFHPFFCTGQRVRCQAPRCETRTSHGEKAAGRWKITPRDPLYAAHNTLQPPRAAAGAAAKVA